MHLAEGHARPADVGGAGLGEESGLEDLRGQGQRGVRRGGVQRGDTDQVPQGLDGARRLAVPGEPAAEVDGVERGVVGVEAAERQCGAADTGPLGEREVRVAGQSGGQVEGHRQCVAAQPSQPGTRGTPDVENGHVQTVLQGRQTRPVDAVEEPAVGGAAAQIDMLSVVDRQFAAPEGEGEAAEPG